MRAQVRSDAYADELGAPPGLDYVVAALASTRALMAGRLADSERLARDAFGKSVIGGSRHADALLAVIRARARRTAPSAYAGRWRRTNVPGGAGRRSRLWTDASR